MERRVRSTSCAILPSFPRDLFKQAHLMGNTTPSDKLTSEVTPSFLSFQASPEPNKMFYLINLGHLGFLDLPCSGLRIWNHYGLPVETIISQNTSTSKLNLRWQLKEG